MAFKLFDTVTALVSLPASGIRAGMSGTVVEAYKDGAVEVEFCDENGATLSMQPMQSAQVSLADIRKAA